MDSPPQGSSSLKSADKVNRVTGAPRLCLLDLAPSNILERFTGNGLENESQIWSAALGASAASPEWTSGATMSLLAARFGYGFLSSSIFPLISSSSGKRYLCFGKVLMMDASRSTCRRSQATLEVPYLLLIVLRWVGFPLSIIPPGPALAPT